MAPHRSRLSAPPTTRPDHRRWRPIAAIGAAGLLAVAAAVPASAVDLGDWDVTGIQFVNVDCSRNEYVVDLTLTGTTDDGGGFDKVIVSVWDDQVEKDARTLEVPVGSTVDRTAFLSFVGTYGSGAPGVGIYVYEADSAGTQGSLIDYIDPFYPEDQEGPCDFDVERIGGPDRIATAALLAQRFIVADTVVVAKSTDYPDALTAAPLADQEAGPLLLTKPTHLPSATAAEITRLQPTTVIVVGGTASVSQDVVDDIQDLAPGATIERLYGSDRYGTAAAVAAEITQDSTQQVFLATGQGFPDALVLSALAARENAPLVLAKADSLPAATEAFLESTTYDDLYAAGGTMVLSDAVVDEAAMIGGATATRYSGADRYETAADVLAQFPAEGKVMVATGEEFADALTAVPVAGRTGAGIALSRPDSVPASVMTEIERLTDGFSYPLVSIVGGEAALSSDVYDQLLALFPVSAPPEPAAPGSMSSNNPQE
ncbi:cell wall-binding repeat-containing protein [Ornithinimicrobium sp. F0845]|uniref:cell wall-binding repeat-containing protein n=1 Tax=Ornithinimicrobium sp. F0845 TaxID=2926412 RepID=UPI001FF29458|nr:cell wall-binding repeat-containing protein [Ornithinimicrobium sp. F0845]MCK0112756.1 cell wall-binding repeat-containing protein [Ornithinimicrobium sp. F0845]